MREGGQKKTKQNRKRNPKIFILYDTTDRETLATKQHVGKSSHTQKKKSFIIN